MCLPAEFVKAMILVFERVNPSKRRRPSQGLTEYFPRVLDVQHDMPRILSYGWYVKRTTRCLLLPCIDQLATCRPAPFVGATLKISLTKGSTRAKRRSLRWRRYVSAISCATSTTRSASRQSKPGRVNIPRFHCEHRLQRRLQRRSFKLQCNVITSLII